MEQSQFNHIIYFNLKCYALKLEYNEAKELYEQYSAFVQQVQNKQQSMDKLAQHIKYKPCDTKVFDNPLQMTEKTLPHFAQAETYYLEEHQTAEKELQDYMNLICPNADSPARRVIDEIVTKATTKANTNELCKENNNLTIFLDSMCTGLNEKFGHNFTYKAPISNSFFMKIMSHPTTRLSASIMLLAGLASLSVGICLLAGLLPALVPSLSIGLTVAGAVATSVSSAVVITGFFGHRDPFDVDKDKNHIQYTNSPAAS